MDQIARYYRHKDHSDVLQTLSDQHCNDLDFDLFFAFADRTSSRVGQQYLYDRLRTIEPASKKSERMEKVIRYFEQHPEERLKVQYQLRKLNHRQAYYIPDLFQKELDQKPGWYFFIPLLSFAALLSLGLSFVYPPGILFFLGIYAVNVLVHYGLKRKTTLFIHAVPSLLSLGAVAKFLSRLEILKEEEPELASSVATISSIRRKMSFFKLEQKVDSDMEAAYWFLVEVIKIMFLLEPLLLFSSLKTLRNKAKDIERVFCFVGKVDILISIASLRHGLDHFCVPEISESGGVMCFKDLVHPLVPACVPNSVCTGRSILLTGSNMSGKTTFIRAIGLNIISGRALNTCFASSATIPVGKLHSMIRVEDDLTTSSSYFFQEVDTMKQILENTGNNFPSIVLLDELFKGTNTVERIASAKAVLSFLTRRNCQVVVSTHDVELTELLQAEYDLFHFSETVDDGIIHFDYKLKAGIPEKGNAIRILAVNGYPSEIIEEAKHLLRAVGKDGVD